MVQRDHRTALHLGRMMSPKPSQCHSKPQERDWKHTPKTRLATQRWVVDGLDNSGATRLVYDKGLCRVVLTTFQVLPSAYAVNSVLVFVVDDHLLLFDNMLWQTQGFELVELFDAFQALDNSGGPLEQVPNGPLSFC